MHPSSHENITRRYLEAVGTQDLETVRGLLTPDVTLVGPAMSLSGTTAVLTAFRRIGAIHVRNDIRRVFVDGDEVCVIYDFVTDLAGSIPTIEWLRFEAGQICAVHLFYDQVPWKVLREELATRTPSA